MTISNTFSKKHKRLSGGCKDVFEYDNIPYGLKVQLWAIWEAFFGQPYLPTGSISRVGNEAYRLCVRHDSAVKVINRLVERGVAVRHRDQENRSKVLVQLTPFGEQVLEKLKHVHVQELKTRSPELCHALQAILDG